MLALFQVTFFDHEGAVVSEVTEDQLGSPERLGGEVLLALLSLCRWVLGRAYLIEVTSQFLAAAALQILLPRKPFPPHTTIFRLADADAAVEAIVADLVYFYVMRSVCGEKDVPNGFVSVTLQLKGDCWRYGMVDRCTMVLSVFWFRCSEAQAIINAEDVIDIGIEVASTCKLTADGLHLENISKNRIEDLRTPSTAGRPQKAETGCT